MSLVFLPLQHNTHTHNNDNLPLYGHCYILYRHIQDFGEIDKVLEVVPDGKSCRVIARQEVRVCVSIYVCLKSVTHLS